MSLIFLEGFDEASEFDAEKVFAEYRRQGDHWITISGIHHGCCVLLTDDIANYILPSYAREVDEWLARGARIRSIDEAK